MLKIEKIKDKSLNLKVQGQGCWSDCWIGGHWENKASQTTAGCNWIGGHYTAKTNIFL